MKHPLKTLLYELFLEPILRLGQRIWDFAAGQSTLTICPAALPVRRPRPKG